jgi:hypothetical protein
MVAGRLMAEMDSGWRDAELVAAMEGINLEHT